VRIVVGLGNPGARYERTRHNIGFLVVEAMSQGATWQSTTQALTTPCWLGPERHEVLLVKPQTFMNRSGQALAELQQITDVEPEQVLVVLDDFLLDFGRLRLRRGGSDGGHNGLASVLQHLSTEAVPRLRLGVGPVPESEQDIEYVLAPFAATEDVDELIQRGCAATTCWVTEGVEAAMNRFNGCLPVSPRADHTSRPVHRNRDSGG